MSFRCVASGFRHDMEELFSGFLTSEKPIERTSTDKTSTDETQNKISLRFTRFSHYWRQMNFSLVFRHRFHEQDLREFIDETYLVVLPNVCSEYALERRVCALYLLYSLFVKQPKNICQKIRVNFSYLKEMQELIQLSKQMEQLDVCFVWYKLWSLGAIDLVLVSRHCGPYFIRNSRATDGTDTKNDFFFELFKTSINMPFNELSQIHEKYQTIKEELSEDNPIIAKECNVVEENIFEKSKSLVSQLLKNRNTALDEPMDTSAINGSEECKETKEKVVSDIGYRRRQLKERALNCKTNTSNAKKTQKIERRYGPITENEIQTENRKKAKGKRGRPKVAKFNAVL